MKPFIYLIMLSASAMTNNIASAQNIPPVAPTHRFIDYNRAMQYCDSTPMRGPEGIYIWPDNASTVLIRASEINNIPGNHKASAPDSYEIIAIESADILIAPGQTLGYLIPSSDPEDYTIYLYSDISYDKVSKPKRKAAKFNPMRSTFHIKGPKLKVTFNPLTLIPRMRSLLRLKIENPLAEIPDGMRRLYPAPSPTPNNPSLPYPRYF